MDVNTWELVAAANIDMLEPKVASFLCQICVKLKLVVTWRRLIYPNWIWFCMILKCYTYHPYTCGLVCLAHHENPSNPMLERLRFGIASKMRRRPCGAALLEGCRTQKWAFAETVFIWTPKPFLWRPSGKIAKNPFRTNWNIKKWTRKGKTCRLPFYTAELDEIPVTWLCLQMFYRHLFQDTDSPSPTSFHGPPCLPPIWTPPPEGGLEGFSAHGPAQWGQEKKNTHIPVSKLHVISCCSKILE